jgi:hypothetical protein
MDLAGEGIRSMPDRIWEVTDRDPLLELEKA